ncbi:retrovirus-related pol polyprotein from transposon TNT 1-94 [Tanacetum coccineum]
MESGSYWLDKVRTSIWRDVRTLAIEEAYTTKYYIHPGADTMLCGFRLTNRWLSMKKDIASCGNFRGNWNTHFRKMSFSLRWGLSFEYGCASFEAWLWVVEGLTLERCSTFGKKDKLELSYVGPFEILGWIGPIATVDVVGPRGHGNRVVLIALVKGEGISQNFSSPYTPEQNGVVKRKNRTLIEAARTMLNKSVLSKHFWTKAVRITCYTQNGSIIVKRHDKTPYDIFRERIPDISYFHVFGCPVFSHNHKDHLVEETYHVTFDESIEAIRFTNTSVDEIGIDDSSRYPPDEFIHKDDPSRQYQTDSDISYYVNPHGRSLFELTQEIHVPEVITPNEPDIPLTKDTEGPSDLINTKGTHEQNVLNDQIITQPTEGPSGNNTEVLVSVNESLVPDVPHSHISNQAFINSHPVPQDRWSKDQQIKLMNIIDDPGKCMHTVSMAAKLIAASATGCLFADFLSEIEPKKVSEALKHLVWVDAMQEELNQFYKNKVWTLVPLPYGKIAIGSK